MLTNRIKYLYDSPTRLLPGSPQHNERMVLTAVCEAVKQATGRPAIRPLTKTSVSIDEVMACMPKDFGTSSHPDVRPALPIHTVLATLLKLGTTGVLSLRGECDFSVIHLSDVLFDAISRMWFVCRGGKHYPATDGHIIHATSLANAKQIDANQQRRLARLAPTV